MSQGSDDLQSQFTAGAPIQITLIEIKSYWFSYQFLVRNWLPSSENFYKEAKHGRIPPVGFSKRDVQGVWGK